MKNKFRFSLSGEEKRSSTLDDLKIARLKDRLHKVVGGGSSFTKIFLKSSYGQFVQYGRQNPGDILC